MRKVFSSVLIVVIGITLLTTSTMGSTEKENKVRDFEQIKEFLDKYNANQYEVKNETLQTKFLVTVTKDKIDNGRPDIKGIPLDDDILDYIWETSIKNDLSYELLLAFAKVESDFTPNIRSKTRDSGMYQVNDNTKGWIAEQLGIDEYDLMDAYTSVDFCVWYLNYLRDYYRGLDMSEEDVYYYTVTAYNKGITGANNYIRKYGKNVKYTEIISYYKSIYEQGGESV